MRTALAIFFSFSIAAVAQLAPSQWKLVWPAHSDPLVTGYAVYYGTAPVEYGASTNVGNALEWVIPKALTGRTYYFALAAYTAPGVESEWSDEVSFHKPIAPTLRIERVGTNQLSVLWSTNLLEWHTASSFAAVPGNLFVRTQWSE